MELIDYHIAESGDIAIIGQTTDMMRFVPSHRVHAVFPDPSVTGRPLQELLQFCTMFDEPFTRTLAHQFLNLLIKAEIYTQLIEENYMRLEAFEPGLQEELYENITELGCGLMVYSRETNDLNAHAILSRFQEVFYMVLKGSNLLGELRRHHIRPVLAVMSETGDFLEIAEIVVIEQRDGFYQVDVRAYLHG